MMAALFGSIATISGIYSINYILLRNERKRLKGELTRQFETNEPKRTNAEEQMLMDEQLSRNMAFLGKQVFQQFIVLFYSYQ